MCYDKLTIGRQAKTVELATCISYIAHIAPLSDWYVTTIHFLWRVHVEWSRFYYCHVLALIQPITIEESADLLSCKHYLGNETLQSIDPTQVPKPIEFNQAAPAPVIPCLSVGGNFSS